MESITVPVYEFLEQSGLNEEWIKPVYQFTILLFILLLAVISDYICKYTISGVIKRIVRKTKAQWDDILFDRKVLDKFAQIVPAILIYELIPAAFPKETILLGYILKGCLIYIIAVTLRFLSVLLSALLDIVSRKENLKDRPLKGLFQTFQVILFFIGSILIISIVINRSPMALFAGLGASAAILLLVFKDTIIGFVSGIQLSAHNMLRAGDWITMEKYGANGHVIEVTLNTVKVRNFDNTITTIPPYALVSDSFQNWRGMEESTGRRIKRSINIDMTSVHFCTQEMLERFKEIKLIQRYLDNKEKELSRFNEEQEIDDSVLINQYRQTNLGIFRAYLESYIARLPQINNNLTYMVRYLQPTEKGIPVELYFFSSEKSWVPYEKIQADVLDHVLAVIPEFGLKIFQSPSGSDFQSLIQKMEVK